MKMESWTGKFLAPSMEVCIIYCLKGPLFSDTFCHFGLLYSMGFDCQQFYNMQLVKKEVKKLDERLKLVLILERWDESLVLLKRLLCLSYDDLIISPYHTSVAEMKPLSREAVDVLRRKLAPEYYFYNHFKRKLNIKVKRAEIKAELAQFRRMKTHLAKKCTFSNTTHTYYSRRGHILNRYRAFKVVGENRKLCSKLFDYQEPNIYFKLRSKR